MAVTVSNNRVLMTTDDDLFPAAAAKVRPNYTVVAVTISKPAASKYYRLKNGGTSGAVVWEYPAVTSPDNIYCESNINISTAGGLWLDTDDTSNPTFKIFLTLKG